MGNLTNKVASGATWMVVMRFLVQSIALLSTLILIRLLTPDDFGIVAMARIDSEQPKFHSTLLIGSLNLVAAPRALAKTLGSEASGVLARATAGSKRTVSGETGDGAT